MDFREINEFFKDTFKYILVIVGVLILFIYIVSFQMVVGESMNPNYDSQDIVVVSKISTKLFEPKRDDVVVFEYKGMKNLIKRVVGLPGDKVVYKDNVLYINDEVYDFDYEVNGKTQDFNSASLGSEVIPEGSYILLGDNRVNSMDSREIGFVKEDDIVGKVVFRFWPLNKFGFVK